MTDERDEADGDGADYEEDDEPVTDTDLLDPGAGPWDPQTEAELAAEVAPLRSSTCDHRGR